MKPRSSRQYHLDEFENITKCLKGSSAIIDKIRRHYIRDNIDLTDMEKEFYRRLFEISNQSSNLFGSCISLIDDYEYRLNKKMEKK